MDVIQLTAKSVVIEGIISGHSNNETVSRRSPMKPVVMISGKNSNAVYIAVVMFLGNELSLFVLRQRP